MKTYDKLERYIDSLIKKSTPQHPFFNVSQGKRFPNNKWDYSCGCMTYAFILMYRQTHDKKYLNFLNEWCDYYVADDGTLKGYKLEHYSTDDVSQSRILFDMYEFTKKEKFLKAIDKSFVQFEKHPRTSAGSFFHKKVYQHQVWLDGLYMFQPLYARCLTHYGKQELYDDIMLQFRNCRKFLFNNEQKLYYHGYDESKSMFWADKKTGLSPHVWLRAVGWLAAAIVDSAYFMDNEAFQKELGKLLQELVDGMLPHQHSSNLFFDIVNMPNTINNYLETSGSALIAYSILKGVNMGIIPSNYWQKGIEIFDSIYENMLIETGNETSLIRITEVSGLGPNDNLRRDGSYQYYMSEPIISNDAKGAGPFIWAYAEILKKDSKK